MKKWLVRLGVPVLALGLGEWWAIATSVPALESESDAWQPTSAWRALQPSLDVEVAGARLRTDAHGQRILGSESALEEDRSHSDFEVLICGGAFTAALGVEDHEHFAVRLCQLLEDLDESDRSVHVQTFIGLGSIEERCRRFAAEVERLDPDLVVVQVEAADNGLEASLFFPEQPAAFRNVQPSKRPVALWSAWEWSRFRSQREAAVARAADWLERDGPIARANEAGRETFLEFQRSFEQRPIPERCAELVRASLDESFSVEGVKRCKILQSALLELFEGLERAHRPFVMFETDAPFLLSSQESVGRSIHLPQVIAPPWWWDVKQQQDIGGTRRPSPAIHEECACLLAAEVVEIGGLAVSTNSAALRLLRERARLIREFHLRARGHELEITRTLRDRVPQWMELADSRTAPWRLSGLGPQGNFVGPAPFALVLSKDPGPAFFLQVDFEWLEEFPVEPVRFDIEWSDLARTQEEAHRVAAAADARGSQVFRAHVELPSAVVERLCLGLAVHPPRGLDPTEVRVLAIGFRQDS